MTNKPTMIEHHTKYQEIHGEDETVWMTRSDHRLLHNRLRNTGQCNVPPDKLYRIATAANGRTAKRIQNRMRYYKDNCQSIHFTEALGCNIQFHEQIIYNAKTGNICYSSRLKGNNGHRILTVEIDGDNSD